MRATNDESEPAAAVSSSSAPQKKSDRSRPGGSKGACGRLILSPTDRPADGCMTPQSRKSSEGFASEESLQSTAPRGSERGSQEGSLGEGVVTGLDKLGPEMSGNGPSDPFVAASARIVGLQGGAEQPEPESETKLFDVHGLTFNLLIGVAILGNAFVIGLETDISPEGFGVYENIFLGIFLFEAILRMQQMGARAYFRDAWCVFDFLLVSVGTLETFVVPVFFAQGNGQLQSFTLLRIFRLLRLLRLIRVLRILRYFSIFAALAHLARHFVDALKIVSTALLLMSVMNFVGAVFLTQVAGHRSGDWAADEEKISRWFGTIGASMRTLFQVMTLDEWSDVVDTLCLQWPVIPTTLGFMLYVVFSSYTIVCLVTALIGVRMVQTNTEAKDQHGHEVESLRRDLTAQVGRLLFKQGGVVSSQISREQLRRTVMDTPHLLAKLQECKVNATRDGILAMVDQLAINDHVSMEYFVEKLVSFNTQARASEVVDVKHLAIHGQLQLIRLQGRVQTLEKKMRKDMDKLIRKVDDMCAEQDF